MLDIGLRIKQLRHENKLTQIEFCDTIDIKQANLSHIENSGKKISVEIIKKIISKFNINANWLLTGEGEMLKTAEAYRIENTPQNIVGERPATYYNKVDILEKEIEYLKKEVELKDEIIKLLRKIEEKH